MSHIPIISDSNDQFTDQDQHHHYHHFTHLDHHHYYHYEPTRRRESEEYNPVKLTCCVYCKEDPGYALTVRHGTVILAPADPSDPHQHWVREDKPSSLIKDERGFPSFALVNKATGEAIKHAAGAGQPLRLVPYDRDGLLDGSILWTVAGDEEYKAIRTQNNVRLNMDAFGGLKDHGGVRDGTVVGLWEWNGGDNQRWKIVPY